MNETNQTEQFRQRVLAGINSYESKLSSEINVYRNQRAWQVMLACRKAYSMMVRGGGPMRTIRWALGGLFGSSLDLHTEDLKFPNIATYLPEELFYPILDNGEKESPRALWQPEARRYDVLVFPVFNYDFRFQRPQQIAVELARRGHRVFWVSPSRVVIDSGKAYNTVALRDNLWELQLHMRPQDLYQGTMARSDLDAMMASLEFFYRDFAIASSCTLVQFPYWRRCALGLRERFGATVVYDCMDDWQNWSAEPAIGSFSLAEERSLTHDCDLLVVTSKEFEERHKQDGLSPLVAKNAADFRFFSESSTRTMLAGLPRPIIGYYGAIADWFDLEAVRQAAKARPKYSFVLIGHCYRNDIDKLSKLPNVFMLGEKNYRDLPSYLRSFDVCLIPFVASQLIKAVDPVKVYEYFSQGKPVVSTPMQELKPLGDLLYFYNSGAELASQLDLALKESDPVRVEQRVEFASRNTWTHRVDDIVERIQSTHPLVSILVVTHNCREFLRACVESVLCNTAYPNFEVVIVDNASTDETQEILREYAAKDSRIRLKLLDKNLGFSGGNNEAARASNGEYLVLLNPDTVVTFGWLHRLLRVFHNHRDAGIAAPVTNFSGNETKVNFDYEDVYSMEKFAAAVATRHMEITFEVSVVPLLCGLVTRKLWDDLGGLDERFQVGMFEDDDFSWRIRAAGLKLLVAEDCFIHHFGNGSFAKLPSEEALRLFAQNRKRFEEKWGKQWTEHKLRPGIKSIADDRRFVPEAFLAPSAKSAAGESSTLQLVKLTPWATRVGVGFNVQPNGGSAIDVECAGASAETKVVFNGRLLETEFANENRVTALVPEDLLAHKGSVKVWLQNGSGRSNDVKFAID